MVSEAQARVKRLGLDDVKRIVRMPIERWDGNCHAVSMALAPHVGGVLRRGLFLGRTVPGAMFHERPCQHSWIELADGSVCDPTRHAFDLTPRFPLWVGPGEEYDVGGCRSAPPAGDPPDPWDTTTFAGEEGDYIELKLSSVEYVADLVVLPAGRYDDAIEVTLKQAAWLANLPVKDEERAGVLCRFFAAEVYEALIEAGHRELIPIDRRDWILGVEHRS